MDMADLIYQQFFLAQHGISLSESNEIADFERTAFVDLALKYEKMKLQLMSPTPLST